MTTAGETESVNQYLTKRIIKERQKLKSCLLPFMNKLPGHQCIVQVQPIGEKRNYEEDCQSLKNGKISSPDKLCQSLSIAGDVEIPKLYHLKNCHKKQINFAASCQDATWNSSPLIHYDCQYRRKFILMSWLVTCGISMMV